MAIKYGRPIEARLAPVAARPAPIEDDEATGEAKAAAEEPQRRVA